MSTQRESSSQVHRATSEIGSPTPMVTLSRNMFNKSSLGWYIFSQVDGIEGRRRPSPVLSTPFSAMTGIREYRGCRALLREGYSTMADILNTSAVIVHSKKGSNLKEYVEYHVRTWLVTPQSQLIVSIFEIPQEAVPLEREEEIVNGVNSVLERLKGKKIRPDIGTPVDNRAFEVFALKFGLRDGVFHSHLDISKRVGIKLESISYIREHLLRFLKCPQVKKQLVGFVSFSKGSIASEVYGAVLAKDLSDDIKAELNDYLLAYLAGPYYKEAEPSSPCGFLLPEIMIPNSQLEYLSTVPIRELRLRAQIVSNLANAGINSLSDLVRCTKETLCSIIKPLGIFGAIEIGNKLQRFLELSGESCPEGFLAAILANNFSLTFKTNHKWQDYIDTSSFSERHYDVMVNALVRQ